MVDFEIVALDPAIAGPAPKVAAETASVREIRFRQKTWLPGELDALRRMVPTSASWEKIAGTLDRSVTAVKSKAWEIGLCRGNSRRWTEDEDRLLFKNYGTVPTSVLAISLDRGSPAIYARAGYLGLQRVAPPPWSEAEDAVLREAYATGAMIAEIAARLGRPGSGVISRASHLGLRRPDGPRPWHPEEQALALKLAEEGHRYPVIRRKLAAMGFPLRAESTFQAFIATTGYSRGWGRPWIDEESDLLRVAYQEGGNLVALAHRLGRSPHSIRWKAWELGLSGSHPKPNGARQGRPWSETDDEILRTNYGHGKMKTRDLAVLLDRPKGAVYNRAFTLGLDHGYFRVWTAEEDLILRIAHQAGISITDLASALKRDPTIVSKRAVTLGIPFASRMHQAPRTPRAKRDPVTCKSILAMAKPTWKGRSPWASFRLVRAADGK